MTTNIVISESLKTIGHYLKQAMRSDNHDITSDINAAVINLVEAFEAINKRLDAVAIDVTDTFDGNRISLTPQRMRDILITAICRFTELRANGYSTQGAVDSAIMKTMDELMGGR